MGKLEVLHQGGDADLGVVTVTSLAVNGTAVSGGVLLGVAEVLDTNGNADALVMDADGDTTLSAPTDDQIDIEINGADDFTFTANTFTALAGSTIKTNTIAETTAASGITADGVLLKDGAVTGASPTAAFVSDGAISIVANGIAALTKAGVGAYTLAAPTNGTHDGYILRIYSETANAHVITGAVDGFNAKGSSGTLTFGGAIGDSVTLVARGGHWYTLSRVNVTVA